MKEYDVVVIGGGSGGLNVAAGSALLGADVALIEKEALGGDCLHHGCVPSKTLIKSAKMAHEIRNSENYGLDAELGEIDFSKVAERIRDVISRVGEHDSPERFEGMGVDVIFGEARFVSRDEVEIGDERIKGKKFVIATGSHPFVPPIDGLEEVDYLTNLDLFSLKELPGSLAVIGGGPIGSEMAQAFARLGSEVTIFEGRDQILYREDKDVAELLMEVFRDEGISLNLGCEVEKVENDKKGVRISYEGRDGEGEEVFDKVLVATGQRPNTEGLGLEKAGVELDDEGSIRVNEKMQTTNKKIYACGDVIGGYQFTHVAEHEAKAIVWNLFFPFKKKVSYDVVPWTTFTDPELARVGLSEEQAREEGFEVYKMKGEEVDRFLTEGYKEGLAKAVVDGKGRIRGATLLLPNAGESIHEFILAIQEGIGAKEASQMIHVYPTVAQANKQVLNKFMSEKYITPLARKAARFFFRIS